MYDSSKNTYRKNIFRKTLLLKAFYTKYTFKMRLIMFISKLLLVKVFYLKVVLDKHKSGISYFLIL